MKPITSKLLSLLIGAVGSDSNAGLTESAPVKPHRKAYEIAQESAREDFAAVAPLCRCIQEFVYGTITYFAA